MGGQLLNSGLLQYRVSIHDEIIVFAVTAATTHVPTTVSLVVVVAEVIASFLSVANVLAVAAVVVDAGAVLFLSW